MNDNEMLKIDGLSALQLEELKAELTGKGAGDGIMDSSSSALAGAKLGEPSLLQVVLQVTPAVLSLVALWLAKQKSKRTETFSYKKVSKDGTSESIDFSRSSYDEGAASASQIESILKSKLDGSSKGTAS
ncbi:hypothetical protein [Paraflavitalea sp. CAU 1676]|uniref:hypothetical protein n=1 Tax=Paraflavitalea sp. CAU 1676 TaxID=3032598 RepID=UPI0023DC7B57|nr:hypothetical protein [Paraflavitalea sp. CAU 1676]MDF2188338.1 hypothetical protein [Paraflavitalea sp. CAU 1676]